jgi:hypothetical protein
MNTNSITTTELLALIEACQARGVLQLKLPNGVEFVLNAAYVPRSSLSKPETTDSIKSSPVHRAKLTDEIDYELFGEPLKNPEE